MDSIASFALIAHAAATWALVGMAWTVQVVHYPLFRHVGKSNFPAYHAWHVLAISWIVFPLVLVELLTAGVLVISMNGNGWFLASLPLLAVNLFSTFRVQVPLHSELQVGFDENTQRRLERSNWVRTIAWSLRGVLIGLAMLPS